MKEIPQMTPLLRRFLLLLGMLLLLAPAVRAEATPVTDAELDEMLVITLVHHWVIEIGGQRFGLIQFDTPMTTVLLGRVNFDLPVPALAVVAPLLTVPILAAVGVGLQHRRRRHGFS